MNTYTTDENGTYIVDLSGKKYRCNTAHTGSVPDGIVSEYRQGYCQILVSGLSREREWCDYTGNEERNFWLARAPLPEVPRPKTQADLDLDAFKAAFPGVSFEQEKDAWGRDVFKHPHVRSTWEGFVAALEYARKEQL